MVNSNYRYGLPSANQMVGVTNQQSFVHREHFWVESFIGIAESLGAHAQRHSDRGSRGVPDISLGWPGGDMWMEWKVQKLDEAGKPRHPMLKNYTRSQHDWMMARSKYNPRCFVPVIMELQGGVFAGCNFILASSIIYSEAIYSDRSSAFKRMLMPDWNLRSIEIQLNRLGKGVNQWR